MTRILGLFAITVLIALAIGILIFVFGENSSRKKILVALAISILLFGFCCWSMLFESEPFTCPPVPNWFSEKYLPGTWVANDYSRKVSDTLIFREDGTYKQIIHIESPLIDYKSDWQIWKLEYGTEGIPYLYLEDFRTCAGSLYPNCDWVNDGKTSLSDCCGNRPTEPHLGEWILTVLGPPDYNTPSATRQDISLMMFRGCETSGWIYSYQEP